jgi:LAO/AO transport system kinase
LSDAIDRHQAWLAAAGRQAALRRQRARYRLKRLLEVQVAEVVANQTDEFLALPLRQQLSQAWTLLGKTIGA